LRLVEILSRVIAGENLSVRDVVGRVCGICLLALSVVFQMGLNPTLVLLVQGRQVKRDPVIFEVNPVVVVLVLHTRNVGA
jgi:hypothetical protein